MVLKGHSHTHFQNIKGAVKDRISLLFFSFFGQFISHLTSQSVGYSDSQSVTVILSQLQLQLYYQGENYLRASSEPHFRIVLPIAFIFLINDNIKSNLSTERLNL